MQPVNTEPVSGSLKGII